MFKSLVEMKSAMCAILISIRDDNFETALLKEEFGEIEFSEALDTCIQQNLITGIVSGRSQSNCLHFELVSPRITYAGLEFIESINK